MTPRYSGVLVEMGTADAEGLLTAEFDRPKLQWLWTHGSSPVRREMPMKLFGQYLPALYGSGRSLADAWPGETGEAEEAEPPSGYRLSTALEGAPDAGEAAEMPAGEPEASAEPERATRWRRGRRDLIPSPTAGRTKAIWA